MSDSVELERTKYRAQAGEIRASFAYVFRIMLGDEIFLVGNEHYDNLRFQPVGGGYRFDEVSRPAVKRFFGLKNAPGTVRETNGSPAPEDNDFRLLLPAAGLKHLCDFFNSTEEQESFCNLLTGDESAKAIARAKELGAASCTDAYGQCCQTYVFEEARPHIRYKLLQSKAEQEIYEGIVDDTARMLLGQAGNGFNICLIPNDLASLKEAMQDAAEPCQGASSAMCSRETVNDMRREFIEEMLESKIVPENMQEAFNTITYLYRGRHHEYFYDERFGTYSYFLCDILDLIPNEEQLEVLRYLKEHEHDDNAKLRYVFLKETQVPAHLLMRYEHLDVVPFPQIADHSLKILSCNFSSLHLPSALATKAAAVGASSPIFRVRIRD